MICDMSEHVSEPRSAHAWLTDTLTKLANRWPTARFDEMMPWAFTKIPA